MPIRMATVEDIPAILAIYGPYVENTCISFEYTVPTEEEFTRRFLSYTARFPWLVWEEEGQLLGYAYGSLPWSRAAYRWSAEASVYVAPQAHRRGIGKALYRALEALIFRQGYRVIYCLITSDNPGSVAFHEAMGYRTVANIPGCGYKFGKQLGILYMEKRSNLSDFPTEPPKTIWDIVENDSFSDEVLSNITLS